MHCGPINSTEHTRSNSIHSQTVVDKSHKQKFNKISSLANNKCPTLSIDKICVRKRCLQHLTQHMAMNCSKIAEEIKSENDSRMLRLLLTDPTIENKRKDTITSSFTSNELHKETVAVNHNLNYTSKTPTILYKRNISL